MRKKTEKRITPFLSIDGEKLKAAIAMLKPQELGEIKYLIWEKIREEEEKMKIIRKRLEKAECPEKRIIDKIFLNQEDINQTKMVLEAFDQRFQERHQKRQKKRF